MQATVTIKLTSEELRTLDEALRLFVYVGHQPPLVVMGRPFEHYTWDMPLDEVRLRADDAEEMRRQLGL